MYVIAVLLLGTAECLPAPIAIDASGAGWMSTADHAYLWSNGNSASNNYLAGSHVPSYAVSAPVNRNHFDFLIPTNLPALFTATLQLFDTSHGGGSLLYSVFSLGAFGSYGFKDIGAGELYGSVTTTMASSGTNIYVPLDSAAVTAITASEGGTFSLGGKSSGESFGGDNFDFGFSGGTPGQARLTIVPMSEAPEPTSFAFVWIASLLLPLAIRIRRLLR